MKTQDFRYHGCELKLSHATNVPQDILGLVREHFSRILRSGIEYRATGITLMKLRDAGSAQLDLFGSVIKTEAWRRVFESVDSLSEKYGKHAVFLGSSFEAMRFGAHLGERGDAPERALDLLPGETERRRLGIPTLGSVD